LDRKDFLLKIEDIVQADPGSLTESHQLADVAGWDSLAEVQFQALADEEFGRELKPADVASCKTVHDLMQLAGVSST
jgi:acyl carrier protein